MCAKARITPAIRASCPARPSAASRKSRPGRRRSRRIGQSWSTAPKASGLARRLPTGCGRAAMPPGRSRAALRPGAPPACPCVDREAVMKWITRERPKIDRIACPWLVARFIDREPEFLFVPADRVFEVAKETGAIPYDIPGAELSHVGERCSFDAFLDRYGLDDPALRQLAEIVRGADTGRPELTPQSPGLLAISLGLSHCYPDDHDMLGHGMVLYDALYAWCRSLRGETHGWPPAA